MSYADSVAQAKSGYPALDATRANQNVFLGDFTYFLLNKIISATAATYPVCDIGSTATKVKTTNATVVLCAGVVNAVSATDNAWTLTGDVLAVSSWRRYLLLVDASDTFTVLASDDSTVSAASCRWSSRPPNGTTILGVLTVATNGSTTFTPGTTDLSAAGITDTYIDGIDIYVPLATILTP